MNPTEAREFLKIQLRFDLKAHVDTMEDELCIELARQIQNYQNRFLSMSSDCSVLSEKE